ncbi:hypothetical protein BH10ACI1_BH10ACI1_11560 [soil metagenome]
MSEDKDWYPSDRPTQRTMYGNIDLKVDSYKGKYPFLTNTYLEAIHAFCQTFIEAFDKIEYNRATGKQATVWFENLIASKQKNTPAPAAPVYQTITLPAGAMLGIEKDCRDFAGLLKEQLNYDKADGLDLMIERVKAEGLNPEEAQPMLKLSVSASGAVSVVWKKTGFDALELQYRKVGTEMWQPADKSTEKVIEFAPPLTTPGVPEKFEFRGIYILKNQRVGNWSPVYTETVG